MDDAPVLTERRAGYRVITLNRPRYLNAFNETMHRALRGALAEAEEDGDCRALLLTGAGGAFCAGQDLRERVTAEGKTTVLGEALETYYNPLVRKLRALPFPVVAAVNGVAAGAGANIALACDIVLAARSATFLQAFAKIGLVHDDGELMAQAHGLCARFAAAPAVALALIKRLLDESWSNDLDTQLDLEREAQREASLSPDYAEGVHAFLQNRPPVFAGRRQL